MGKTRPLKVEKPRMRRLREELRSTYCERDRNRQIERLCFVVLPQLTAISVLETHKNKIRNNLELQKRPDFDSMPGFTFIRSWQVNTGQAEGKQVYKYVQTA